MKKARVVLTVFAVFLLAGSVAAQTGMGRISGTVFDPTGAVIVGASVKVTSDLTGVARNTTTSESGQFLVALLPPGKYKVEVQHTGFRTHLAQDVEVTIGADHVMRISLEPGVIQETVTVSEAAVQVQTTEMSVSSLVDAKTLVQLPLNRRNPLHFLGLIPGVVGHSAQATSSSGTVTHHIHGDRGRGILTTLDGIDISDPIIPRGELSNAPVNPDMVQEFRVTTSLPRAEYGRNSGAQIEMGTRGGGNEIHGTTYHFLRNTSLDANDFFNNQTGQPRERLIQNQFGASVGGPFIKNKLFGFFNYEGTRRLQSFIETSTVYTQAARQGLFRYVRGTVTLPDGTTTTRLTTSLVDSAGNLQAGIATCGGTVTTNCIDTYNIVANDPRALGLNASMQALIGLFPLPNDFTGGDGLNTAVFRWNAPANAPSDNYTGKVDWIISPKYELFVRYNLAWRNDLVGDFINGALPRSPSVGTGRHRLSRNQSSALGLKMVLSSRVVNDVRLGFTRNRLNFADPSHPWRSGDAVFSKLPELRTSVMRTPWIYWGGTNRYPEHFQAKDNLSIQRGNHALRFGVDARIYRFNNSRNVGSNPQGSGISVFPSVFFTQGVVPFTGIQASTVVANSTDRTRLLGMFNELLGIVAQMDQIMYSDGTQYVPGLGLIMYQRQAEYSAYVQNDWRLHPRLTLNLGLRYEYFGVPYDSGGLQVVPDRPLDQGPVTFLPGGPGRGRGWYGQDLNDYAPAVGFAWDPFGGGKTSVRGGYRVSYNRLVGWALNVLEQRQPAVGLDPQIRGACFNPSTGALGACGGANVPFRLGELNRHPSVVMISGVPHLAPPSPNVIQSTPPNTRRESPFFFDDNFKTAYVHQISLNIQREVMRDTVVEVGYVGSLGRNLFKFLNVNQIELSANGFLQEFINAQNNLAICRATTGCTLRFSNQGLTGQVPVPIFSALFSSTGSQTASGFSDSTNITALDLNNIGSLADRLDKSLGGSRGPLAAFGNDRFFRPNPQFDVAGLGASVSTSDYHAVMVQIRARTRYGLQYGANYTFSKSLDDQSNETVGAGTSFDFALDSKNLRINRGRSDFDVNHVFRAYGIYDLPFGRGRRWASNLHGAVDRLIGGWQVNTIIDVSSGFPFTVSSASQTLNYFVTSPANCAAGAFGSSKLNKSDSRGGVWYFDSAAVSQFFSIPAPGTTGTCGRNSFTGPNFVQVDLGFVKTIPVTEGIGFDFRAEMFNAFNHANFSQPTTSIQSANFGRISSTRAPNRIMQFGLRLNF